MPLAIENVDAVIVIGGAPSLESNRDFTKAIIEARNEFQTPFIMIGMPGQEPEYAKIFFDAKLPFYESSERAAKNYSDVLNYQRWKRAQI